MATHHKINYVELPAQQLEAAKEFFSQVFGWSFVDYGPDYAGFVNAGLDGGFFRAPLSVSASKGSALVVLYSAALEETLKQVEAAGGTILQDIFSFPGGRRFHFADPSDNEFAVWSE